MTGPVADESHAHAPTCRAVQFDPDTGRYTGTCAFDELNCQTCRDEKAAL